MNARAAAPGVVPLPELRIGGCLVHPTERVSPLLGRFRSTHPGWPVLTYRRADVMMFGLRNVIGTQGGVETHVRHLTEHLARSGLYVEILVRSPFSRDTPSHIADNIKLTSIWAPRGVGIETIVHSLIAVIYALIRRPRLLHIHAIGPGLMTPIARLFGIAVVVTHHGEDYNREKWGWIARWTLRSGERLVARFANECIVVSRPLTKELSKRFARTFEYIPNGVNLATAAAPTSTLSKFGLNSLGYILNVGRLVPEKRQMDILRAFQALDRSDLRLVLVGAADHDNGYGAQLEACARRDERIVMTGFQQGAALAELFRNAAFFTLASSHEGLPIAVLEAMSYGLPVMVSDILANLALKLPDSCYVETGNVAAWTARIKKQLDRPRDEWRFDWSAYLQPYKWTDVAGKTILVYNRIWDSRNSSEADPSD